MQGLQNLIDSGQLTPQHFFYNLLRDVINCCKAHSGNELRWSDAVYECLETLAHLGGEQVVNVLRGGGFDSKTALHVDFSKMNIPLPSMRSIRARKPAHTTDAGVEAAMLKAFLRMAECERRITPLCSSEDSPKYRVFPVAMQRDGLALKPGIEQDSSTKRFVGGKEPFDLKLLAEHPNPDGDFIKNYLVTEANQLLLVSLCGDLGLPIGTDFTGRSKTAAEIAPLILQRASELQVCLRCMVKERGTVSNAGIVQASAVKTCLTECKGDMCSVSACQSQCDCVRADCIFAEKVCERCEALGITDWDPAFRPCFPCIQAGIECLHCAVLLWSSDCEKVNKSAMTILETKRKEGQLPDRVQNLHVKPDSVHVGKSFWDSFCNWPLRIRGHRVFMAMLRTLRDDTVWAEGDTLRRVLPLTPLTGRDQQAPENILHASKDTVLAAVKDAGAVMHTIVPEKYKKADGNKRALQHPIAVAISGNLLAFIEADTGALTVARMHVPIDAKVSARTDDTLHGVAFVGDTIVVTVPSANELRYVDLKQGSSEMNPARMSGPDLKKALQERDESGEGSVLELRSRLKQLLADESKAMFGEEEDANAAGHEGQAANRRRVKPARKKKLRSMELSGDKLQAPLAIATHPAERNKIAVSDRKTCRIALVTLTVKRIQLVGAIKYVSPEIRPGAELNAVCWQNESYLLCLDSSKLGGLFRLNVETKVTTQLLVNGGIRIAEGKHIPMRPFGVAVDHKGRIFISDAAERTVRQYIPPDKDAKQQLLLYAGSSDPGFRDGTARTGCFEQPLGIAADGASLLVCDAGSGSLKLISKTAPMAAFLERLKLIYRTFGVHLRGSPADKATLATAITNMRQVNEFFKLTVADVQQALDIKRTVNGPDGSISNDSLQSMQMITTTLESLQQLFKSKAKHPGFEEYHKVMAMKSCTTLLLERFFAQVRAAVQTPTQLAFCRVKLSAARELVKQATRCAFFYPSARNSFYPAPETALPFSAIKFLKKVPIKERGPQLSEADEQKLRDHAQLHFKPTPQNTVRNSYCKSNAGTLPINAYGPAVELKSNPMDLDGRAADLAKEVKGDDVPIPEAKRSGDGKTVYLAVMPGNAPSVLHEEVLYIVATDEKFFDDKRYDKLKGDWFVPNLRQPQVFTYMATADLLRSDIIKEINCEEFTDDDKRRSVLLDDILLFSLLAASRRTTEAESEPYAEDERLEDDAHDYFGHSQQPRAGSEAARHARDDRAQRRSSQQDSSSQAME